MRERRQSVCKQHGQSRGDERAPLDLKKDGSQAREHEATKLENTLNLIEKGGEAGMSLTSSGR